MRPRRQLIATAVVTALAGVPQAGLAANAEFQTFFFGVCTGATGALATRCGQTPGGLGNLSGDSESSLNPSQNLSQTLAPIELAHVSGAEARDRGERARDESEATPVASASIAIGPFAIVANARGTWFERERDLATDQERGLDGDTRALELGIDKRVSDRFFLGALLAAEQTDYEYDPELPGVNFTPAASAGDAETDAWSFTGYLTFNAWERGFLEVSVGYVRQEHTYRRNSVFQESTRAVAQTNVDTEGETDGNVLWASMNLGYDWNSGASTFGPYAGVTYARSKVDAYAETDLSGSGLSMAFGETDRTSAQGHVGLRFDRAISTGRGVFVPQLRVEYLHEFEDEAPEATASFVLDGSATQFAFVGDEPESGVLSTGLGATAILPGGWIWFLNVDYIASGDVERSRATLGLRAEF